MNKFLFCGIFILIYNFFKDIEEQPTHWADSLDTISTPKFKDLVSYIYLPFWFIYKLGSFFP